MEKLGRLTDKVKGNSLVTYRVSPAVNTRLAHPLPRPRPPQLAQFAITRNIRNSRARGAAQEGCASTKVAAVEHAHDLRYRTSGGICTDGQH